MTRHVEPHPAEEKRDREKPGGCAEGGGRGEEMALAVHVPCMAIRVPIAPAGEDWC